MMTRLHGSGHEFDDIRAIEAGGEPGDETP
jgi:hypothetical protein